MCWGKAEAGIERVDDMLKTMRDAVGAGFYGDRTPSGKETEWVIGCNAVS